MFDGPLAPHHKLIGRWVATREPTARRYTRHQARQRIERVFGAAVAEVFKPFDLVNLRVVALVGETGLPPALAVVCEDIGQINLGWIEKSNILSNTVFGNVAPVGWRAAAYQALARTLPAALPVFGFEDLVEELSAYYWDGATDDAGARAALTHYHGEEAVEEYEFTLPSEIHARRPDWMTAKPAPLKHMPATLRAALKRLTDAHAALRAHGPVSNAWHVDHDQRSAYIPGLDDCSHLPPLTIVPFDQFAREIDDVARFGMDQGFFDIAGLCPLSDAAAVDTWFASLRIGAEYLLAAQALINLDPANAGGAA